MTRIQRKHRARLVETHRAALARWPHRSGQEFVRDMQAVARDLETLALQIDASSCDSEERARTWDYVAAAYRDLGGGQDSEVRSGRRGEPGSCAGKPQPSMAATNGQSR